MKLTGKILWYSDRDQNGIIKTESGTEYYFDRSVLVSSEFLSLSMPRTSGLKVTFEHNDKIKDYRCAKNVTLA